MFLNSVPPNFFDSFTPLINVLVLITWDYFWLLWLSKGCSDCVIE